MARKLAPDKWLFAATIGLALFGVVMVYSASAMMAEKENGNQFHYVLKQGVWVAIGFVVLLLTMQFNYQQLKSRRVVYGLLFITTIALISVYAFSSSNGAHRWIKLQVFSVQPSELSKLALTIFLAYFLEKRAGEEGDFWRTFVPCGLVTCLLAALIIPEPDLGTALMLMLIFFIVIYTAGARVVAVVG
jgi:cell division protein FtsW